MPFFVDLAVNIQQFSNVYPKLLQIYFKNLLPIHTKDFTRFV